MTGGENEKQMNINIFESILFGWFDMAMDVHVPRKFHSILENNLLFLSFQFSMNFVAAYHFFFCLS